MATSASSHAGLRRVSSTGNLASNGPVKTAVAAAVAAPSRLRQSSGGGRGPVSLPVSRSTASLRDLCPPPSATFRSDGGSRVLSRMAAEAVAANGQAQQEGPTVVQGATQQGAPYASLTRVFLIGQPSNIMRNLAGRKWRAAGPVSLLLFLAGMLVGILTAVRTVLVRRVKSCQCCRGYGIVRCRLCNGEGSVEWRGKNNHQENCPLCMTRRYVTCPDCGGHYHRKMFSHVRPVGRGPVPEFLGA